MDIEKEIRNDKGQLQPGHGGLKKPGSANKISGEVRQLIADIISENFSKEKIQEDLKKVKPNSRLKFLCEFLPYILAKQKEIKIEDSTPGGFGNTKIDYTKLSPEVLKQILAATTVNPEDGQDIEHIVTGMTIK